jgi:hypothetical protein
MLTRIITILCVLIASVASAQNAGETRYSSGRLQFYNGTAWKNTHFKASGFTCTGITAGRMRLYGTYLQVCDGTDWRNTHTENVGFLSACSRLGEMQYASSEWQFCNGSSWARMRQGDGCSQDTAYVNDDSGGFFYRHRGSQFFQGCCSEYRLCNDTTLEGDTSFQYSECEGTAESC